MKKKREGQVPEAPERVRVVAPEGEQPSAALLTYAEIASVAFSRGTMLISRCLNASWITARTLRRLGLPAQPMSVDATLGNAAMLRLLQKHGRGPTTQAEGKAWADAGAWMIQCDPDRSPEDEANNRFPGHVVVLSGDWVVDAAASQFHRPARRIAAPEVLLFKAPVGFATGEEAAEVPGMYGDMAVYRARPWDRRHEHAEGFSASHLNIRTANEVERAVRKLLSASEPGDNHGQE